jgi:hypothetical protein
MSAAGFGDLYTGAAGFGDPYPTGGGDVAGFGDPYDTPTAALSQQSRRLPHTGGAPVIIRGELPPELGPYMLTMNIDGQPRPLYSGHAGQGPALIPLRGELRAYTYPSPAGTYPLTLHYGPSYGASLTLSETLTIEPAPRLAERYAIARQWPAHYATGPRDSLSQPIDTAAETPTRGALEIILETAAQLLTMDAAPATVTTAPTAPQAAPLIPLESSLGFPEAGRVWIAGELYDYELSGQALQLSATTRRHIPARTEVTLYVYRTA